MSKVEFTYRAAFPLGRQSGVLPADIRSRQRRRFEGETILKVAPEALTLLAQQAFHDASFMPALNTNSKSPQFSMIEASETIST